MTQGQNILCIFAWRSCRPKLVTLHTESKWLDFTQEVCLYNFSSHWYSEYKSHAQRQPTCSAPRWARRTRGSPASPSSGTWACQWARRERQSQASWWSEAAWPDEAFWCRRWPAVVETTKDESVVTQEGTHSQKHIYIHMHVNKPNCW